MLRKGRDAEKSCEIEDVVAAHLEATSRQFAEREAFFFSEEMIRLSYSQLRQGMDDVAKALMAIGLQKGDHLAIFSANCSRWLFLLLGAAKIGVVIVPVNTNYRSEEIKYILKQSNVQALFLMPHLRGKDTGRMASRFLEKEEKLENLRYVISMADQSETHMGWLDFMAGGKAIDSTALAQAACEVRPEDVYCIQYTSGTTARAKGALLSHFNVLSSAREFGKRFRLTPDDVNCVPLPMFHVFGNVLTTIGGIMYGCKTVIQSTFSARTILPLLQNERCTLMMGVPTMYCAIIAQPDFDTYELALTKGGIGGAICSPAVTKMISDRFQMPGLAVGYGLSETAALCTLSDITAPEEERLCSVGPPLDGVEVRVMSLTGSGEAAEGEPGELEVRGSCVMSGYYNMPEETRAVLDGDGWLHTGDMGTRDANGCFHVIDRLKDIVIRGGENISPSEIENVLLDMDNIYSAQCVGVRDEFYGEQIAAFVITKDGTEMPAPQLQAYVKARLACCKVPQYVCTVDSFPTNASGKVLKRCLQKMANERFRVGH